MNFVKCVNFMWRRSINRHQQDITWSVNQSEVRRFRFETQVSGDFVQSKTLIKAIFLNCLLSKNNVFNNQFKIVFFFLINDKLNEIFKPKACYFGVIGLISLKFNQKLNTFSNCKSKVFSWLELSKVFAELVDNLSAFFL